MLGAAWLPLALSALLQVQVEVPDPAVPRGAATQYGHAERRDLAGIAHSPELYVTRREHVITSGRLDMLQPPLFYVLSDGGARVLLIPGHGVEGPDLQRYVGRVEIRGIVRSLRPKEYVQGVDIDLIEDAELPVLPPPRSDLPRVSITVLGLADADEHRESEGAAGGVAIRQIVADPARYSGAKVSVVGRFRGRNLYGDVPRGTQRGASDWVLHDGAAAVWVRGKPPRGKGWSLDPDDKADTSRWLEVSGRIEVVADVVYLRASKVALTKPPHRTAQDPTP